MHNKQNSITTRSFLISFFCIIRLKAEGNELITNIIDNYMWRSFIFLSEHDNIFIPYLASRSCFG